MKSIAYAVVLLASLTVVSAFNADAVDVPEFSGVAAGIAFTSAGALYLLLRNHK